jgi:hypothetical protein
MFVPTKRTAEGDYRLMMNQNVIDCLGSQRREEESPT